MDVDEQTAVDQRGSKGGVSRLKSEPDSQNVRVGVGQ